MKTIGRHLIAEYYGAQADVLDNAETIRSLMLATAERIGATVVGETFHKFAPQGVSGTVVIAESHLSVHTWPEVGYVAVDIYTCGGLNPHGGIAYLGNQLGADSFRVQEIVRGLPDDIASGRALLPSDVQIITHASEPIQLTHAAAPVH